MPLITTSVPNLIGGVSQQPDTVRFPNQCDEMINAVPSITDGLSKRPPTEHLKTLQSWDSGGAYTDINPAPNSYKTHVHTINRDVDERYVVSVTQEVNSHGYTDGKARAVIRVNDIDGNPKEVRWDSSLTTLQKDYLFAYLSPLEYSGDFSYTAAPDSVVAAGAGEPDLEFATVADVTFILNKQVRPQSHNLLTPSGPWSGTKTLGTIWVKRIETAAEYGVRLTSRSTNPATNEPYWSINVTATAHTTANNVNYGTLEVAKDLAVGIASGFNNASSGIENITGAFKDAGHTGEVYMHNSVILIKMTSGGSDDHLLEYDIVTSDDMGGTAMVGFTDEVRSFTDLPPRAFHNYSTTTSDANYLIPDSDYYESTADPNYVGGTRIKVNNAPTSTADDYYVEGVSVGKGSTETIASSDYRHDTDTYNFSVRWRECAAPNVSKGIFPHYGMPLLLIRQSDGSFLVKAADGTTPNAVASSGERPDSDAADVYNKFKWRDRIAGDLDTNPDPTFVGFKINGMVFHDNRLVFLSDENVVMSEAGDSFNFYRTSTIRVLDQDPIDVSTTNQKVSVLRNAVGFGDRLLMMSDQTQFVCWGDPILTPSLVTINPVTYYESLKSCPIVTAGSSAFFGFKRGQYSGVREWFSTGTSADSYTGIDITAHIPAYIKGEITEMAFSSHENILVSLTDTDRDTMYVYYFYGDPENRVQSAWGKFKVGGTGAIIHDIEFIDTTLYLVVERPAVGGGNPTLHLEKMQFQSELSDTGSEYITTLDRRLAHDSTGVSTVYNSDNNYTTITIPYNISEGVTMSVVSTAGFEAQVEEQTAGAKNFKVTGDWTGSVSDPRGESNTFWIGEKYDMSYKFTKPLLKQATGGSQRSNFVAQGRHQLRYATVVYSDTAGFQIKVTPEDRETTTYDHTGRSLGTSSAIMGSVALTDGEFRFPVFAQSDKVAIELVNSGPLPCHIESAEFEATYTTRSRRM